MTSIRTCAQVPGMSFHITSRSTSRERIDCAHDGRNPLMQHFRIYTTKLCPWLPEPPEALPHPLAPKSAIQVKSDESFCSSAAQSPELSTLMCSNTVRLEGILNPSAHLFLHRVLPVAELCRRWIPPGLFIGAAKACIPISLEDDTM